MGLDPVGASIPAVPTILIPEVRDFVRINAEIRALLNLGHSQLRLEGAEGQRLLASGLVGSWQAVIEIEGRTGPEFAANLDAPGLRIIGRGSTLDGAGRGCRAGTIIIVGNAGDGLGSAQIGGLLVLTGNAGHRSGLGQSGGILAILGSTGRLSGDRQSGGVSFLGSSRSGPYPGRGQSGGRWIGWEEPLEPADRAAWDLVVAVASPWIDPSSLIRG